MAEPDLRLGRHRAVEVTCERCALVVVRRMRHDGTRQRFCSFACADASFKELGQAGERNPNFKGWKSRNKVAYKKAFQARYPHKAAAHRAVHDAVQSGRLARQPCEVCGSAVDVHAHHDSYEPNRRLDVRWLCRPHHRQWHDENDRPMGNRPSPAAQVLP